jgi:adenylate cyclase
MAEEKFRRKLTAILSADVAGYSRLMAEDETATVKTLETYREVMSTLIKQHRGRVIDSPGDNLLAEFTSVVDAVQCAVAVQKEFQARNAELPENRRMEFRIGINLGDVIEEGERIYGDGVNIAARLEALADPGGICVSKTAFDQIETKLPLGYEYLGEQEVKNIPKPVGAFRVLMEPRVTVAEEIEKEKPGTVWRRKAILAGGVVLVLVVIAALIWNFYFRPPPIEVASEEKMAFELPDKPSIAVLPFDNLTGDPEQEYFSDGITEAIINGLSKIPNLFVISRKSSFTYKGKQVKVQQVSEELGVRYVLEGSVQRSGDRVRITAQLVDAIKGHHLWSNNYDRDLKEIFSLQDEIMMRIMTALRVKLTEGEQARVWAKGIKNVQAYLKLLKGTEYYIKRSPTNNKLAKQFFEEVIEIDPECSVAYAFLGYTHIYDRIFRTTKDRKKSLQSAFEMAEKALALDESNPDGHLALSWARLHNREHDMSIVAAERAVALSPNYSTANIHVGVCLIFSGRPAEAIPWIKKAMRLNPFDKTMAPSLLGLAYCTLGRYDEAISILKDVVRDNPNFFQGHLFLTITYAESGHEEEARAEGKEILRLSPKFSLEGVKKVNPLKKQSDRDRWIEALRKAGVK